MKFLMIPYTRVDGVPTFKDSEILALYDQMVADGTATRVFYDKSVRTSAEFLNLAAQPTNMFFVIKDEAGNNVAVAWLNCFEGRAARCHFCMLSQVWGKHTTEIGRQFVDYILGLKQADGRYLFETLIGVTPSRNRLALALIRRIGFKILGEVPGLCFNNQSGVFEPGVYSCITRERLHHEDLHADHD